MTSSSSNHVTSFCASTNANSPMHGSSSDEELPSSRRSSPDTTRSSTAEKVLFERFEHVASSVTKLYSSSTWPAFQQAAGAATLFYKESIDAYRKGQDWGVALGRQALCKELLAALQLSNNAAHPYVRRDDCVDLILRLATPGLSAAVANHRASPNRHGAAAAAEMDFQSDRRPFSYGAGRSPTVPSTRFVRLSPEPGIGAIANNNSSDDVSDQNLAVFQQALLAPAANMAAFLAEEFRRHATKRRRGAGSDSPASGGDDYSDGRKRHRRT